MTSPSKTIPGVKAPRFKHEQYVGGSPETYLGHYEGHDLYFSPDNNGAIYARYSDAPSKCAGMVGFWGDDDFASIANDYAPADTSRPHCRALWVGKAIAIGMKLTDEIEVA